MKHHAYSHSSSFTCTREEWKKRAKSLWVAFLTNGGLSLGAEMPVEPKVLGLEGIVTHREVVRALAECPYLELFEAKQVQALLQ